MAAADEAPLLMLEQGTHGAPVRRIAVDPQRGIAVTASDDRTARVWDLASGELLHVLRPQAFGAEGGRLYGVAIHPTQPLVAVGGTTGGEGHAHRIYLFDLQSGQLQRTIDARAGDVRKLSWSQDGTLLLATYAGTHGLRAYTPEGLQVFEERLDGASFGLDVSRSGLAAAVSLNGQLRTYRAAGGQVSSLARVALAGRRAAGVSFSPDGRRLAVAYADAGASPEVFDAENGQLLAKLPVVTMFGGDLRVVAWSADGQAIVAGGTGHTRNGDYLVWRFDAAGRGAPHPVAVARDSVTDLVALPNGEVAYTGFDGSWGVLRGEQALQRAVSPVTYIRVPEDIELSADAMAVRWGMNSMPRAAGFQLGPRRTDVKGGAALRAPELRFSMLEAPSDWNLARGSPIVGGRPLALAQDERSRALVVMRTTESAAIGTNRALYKLTRKGELQWRVPVDTEIRGLNASEDGRWIVSAMADGTLRWWRTRDGVLLVTLLLTADGRWVMWTPSGYYDASTGADRLVGWAVARAGSAPMDFYTLNRFRDQYNRPDVIDALLRTQDERAAFNEQAAREAAERESMARHAAAEEERAKASARAAAEAAEQLRLAETREAQAREAERRAAQEAAAKAEAARQAQLRAEAQIAAARQQAEREQAEREVAARVAEARAAQAREAAERQVVAEASRLKAKALSEQEAAARTAEAQQAAAREAREAQERQRMQRAREEFSSIRALEFPPALSALDAKRIKATSAEVTLPFAVSSHASAGQLVFELRVNGRPAQDADLTAPAAPDGASRGFAKLMVGEGETIVEIIARNRYGASEPLGFKIERPVAQAAIDPRARTPAGDLYVLAIGVSDYARAEYKLNLPAKDATDFAQAMRAQEGKQYRRVFVRILTNQTATKAGIARDFDWLRQTVGPGDTAMLFMAGHGLNDAAGQYFFLPHEGQHDRLAATALSQSAIVGTLSRIRGRTVFFIDTCFAGNALGALRQARRQTERMMNDLSSSENGVVVFASSTGQEESEENDAWGNGAFTKVLLEGLRGKADFTRAGRVTYAGLNLFISEEVTRLTEGRQRPVFISPRGVPDFALARL
jgi:WD40 repeat protein